MSNGLSTKTPSGATNIVGAIEAHGFPLHVISTVNSTTALLTGGATFTGDWEDVTQFSTVAVAILGSLATDGTLFFDLSTDGGVTFTSVPASISDATQAVPRILNVVETHVRIRYVNGTAAMTGTFSLQTKYSNSQQMELLSSINGVITDETPTQVVRSVITGLDDDGVYRNANMTRGGDQAVTITDADLQFHTLVTPGGALKVAEQTHLAGEAFGTVDLNTAKWSIDVVGSGSQDATGDGELSMSTGTTANSSVEIESIDVARFIPANYNTTHHAVTIPDGASYAADNSRKWGAINATNASGCNGVYFEIDSGSWYVAHCHNGVATRVEQADWNGPGASSFPDESISANVYECEYNAGSIIFRVNGFVIHRFNLTLTPYTDNVHFPVGMSNTNSNGSTTDVDMRLRSGAIYTLGKGTGVDRPCFILGSNGTGAIIKSGPGHLGKVILSRTGSTGGDASVAIYDAVSASAPDQVGSIAIGGDDVRPVSYDFTFNTGLFIVIAGTGTLGTTVTFD